MELELCPPDFDNHVPCFNVSENLSLGLAGADQYDRNCGTGLMENCLILPPSNYRLPLRWPTGRDVIWVNNVKITAQEVLSSGSLTKRMMVEEEQISFRSASLITDGIEDYCHQIAEMIGLRNESNLIDVGVRTILDIGCGYGSFGAHLFSKQILTTCIAEYEISGSQVQLTLERGLPAMIASFRSKQLPYPALSFDMLSCIVARRVPLPSAVYAIFNSVLGFISQSEFWSSSFMLASFVFMAIESNGMKCRGPVQLTGHHYVLQRVDAIGFTGLF
uniref:Methyltransferase n=1 Tax=Kalanchoe fedtschenkoi TaxID=63787 RepID=A0A7N0T2Y5_KALFE